jgi:hypothetical protein
MKARWITIVETKAFEARAKSRMTREEVDSVITMIADNPTCGDVIKGTGGIRKVRFAIGGKGKRGGVRVVYYFYNEDVPVFLLTVFAKNERSDLTQTERRTLAKLVKKIRESY